jgi:hypothetical protein
LKYNLDGSILIEATDAPGTICKIIATSKGSFQWKIESARRKIEYELKVIAELEEVGPNKVHKWKYRNLNKEVQTKVENPAWTAWKGAGKMTSQFWLVPQQWNIKHTYEPYHITELVYKRELAKAKLRLKTAQARFDKWSAAANAVKQFSELYKLRYAKEE